MESKRDKLLEAAIRLFAADGFWKTSTASIAKAAGVANGTLFNCFSSKDELINAVYSELKNRLLQAVTDALPADASFRDRLQAAWRAVVVWSLDNPVEHQLLEQLRMSELVSNETRDAVTANFAFIIGEVNAALERGELVALPLSYHLEIMFGQMNAQINFLQSEEAGQIDRDAAIRDGFDVWWRGVVT